MPNPQIKNNAPRHLALATAIAVAALVTTQAQAAPPAYTTPHISTASGAESVTHGGDTFTNQGLQGVARLPASTRDFNGDTLGAFSGMDVFPGVWRKTDNGYTGTLYSLPDRGPNGVGAVDFSDFAGRVSSFDMNFTPYTSTTDLPASADSQQQLKLNQTGGFFFKDFNGNLTTGFDPGTGATAVVTQNGVQLPGSTVGAAAGKISLDAEGLRFLNDGSFYVSDEYGANVYYFDPQGNMKGVVLPPPAIIPRDAAGNLFYTSASAPATGRRQNQGMEGIALTPDSKKLVALLQSGALQDAPGGQENRTNTRLVIYDIADDRTPSAASEHYVLQLPIYTSNGNGGAANRTAAQSEILALNDTQFLVLARDGNGLGQGNLNPVYKTVLLVDTAGATNLAGTPYDTSATPVAPGGVLDASIVPMSQVEVVNILNTTQLNRFGVNINNTAPTRLTLTEKMEGMALLPVLDDDAPQDYFLMVANDNDFLSSTCSVGGEDCSQPVDSDTLVLVYRMTLPSYVDSQHLESMLDTAPMMQSLTSLAARDISLHNSVNIGQHLANLRHTQQFTSSVWLTGSHRQVDESDMTPDVRSNGFTLGLDMASGDNLLFGLAAGFTSGDATTADIGSDYDAFQASVYGAFRQGGLQVNGSFSFSDIAFNDMYRTAAYGLTASGDTEANSLLATGELVYLFENDNMRFGPVAGVRWLDTSIDSYVEANASGGNVRYGELDTDKVSGYIGGEASLDMGMMRSIFRLVYSSKNADDTLATTAALAYSTAAMATQQFTVDTLAQDYYEPSITLTGLKTGRLDWWFNYTARIGEDDGSENQVTAGFKLAL